MPFLQVCIRIMYSITHKNVGKKEDATQKVGIIINSNGERQTASAKHLNIKINYMTIYGICTNANICKYLLYIFEHSPELHEQKYIHSFIRGPTFKPCGFEFLSVFFYYLISGLRWALHILYESELVNFFFG